MILVFAVTTSGTEYGEPPLRRRFPVQRTLEVQMSKIDRFSDITAVREDSVDPTVFYRLDSAAFAKHA